MSLLATPFPLPRPLALRYPLTPPRDLLARCSQEPVVSPSLQGPFLGVGGGGSGPRPATRVVRSNLSSSSAPRKTPALTHRRHICWCISFSLFWNPTLTPSPLSCSLIFFFPLSPILSVSIFWKGGGGARAGLLFEMVSDDCSKVKMSHCFLLSFLWKQDYTNRNRYPLNHRHQKSLQIFQGLSSVPLHRGHRF